MRADDRNLLPLCPLRLKRQHRPLVLQQDDGLARQIQGGRLFVAVVDRHLVMRQEGLVVEAGRELQLEHTQASLVHQR